jgi:hypothetical protein
MTRQRMPIAGLLGLCALFALILRAAAPWPAPASSCLAGAPGSAPRPRTPAAVALRQAWRYRTRAKLAVNREREALEQWDPQAAAEQDPEAWRLQLLAANPNGDMGRAGDWARQAAALARTTDEASRAAELQVLLAHEAGDQQAALRQARRWVALAPGSPVARMVLKRAQNWRGWQDCLPDGAIRRTASARR